MKVLRCAFENKDWPDSKGSNLLYTCTIRKASYMEPQEEITKVIGDHLPG